MNAEIRISDEFRELIVRIILQNIKLDKINESYILMEPLLTINKDVASVILIHLSLMDSINFCFSCKEMFFMCYKSVNLGRGNALSIEHLVYLSLYDEHIHLLKRVLFFKPSLYTHYNGESPLSKAFYNGCSIEIYKLLLENGAHVNQQCIDEWGNTSLHSICYNQNKNADSYIEIIELLLDNGADVNLKSKKENTPGHMAAYSESIGVIEILIKNGLDMNITNEHGEAMLHTAAKHNFDILQLLVCSGADLNITNEEGKTALHLAMDNRDPYTAEFLIKNGSTLSSDHEGNTPLHIAAKRGFDSCMELILEREDLTHSELDDSLYIASECDNRGIVKMLLDKGADVNYKERYGRTSLHAACKEGYDDIVKILLDNEANVNAQDDDGWTPLHLASSCGRGHCVEKLLSGGADKNILTINDETALQLAEEENHYIRQLLENEWEC